MMQDARELISVNIAGRISAEHLFYLYDGMSIKGRETQALFDRYRYIRFEIGARIILTHFDINRN